MKWEEFLEIIKAIRNGFIYGTKVRFPHALVITALYKDADLVSKAKQVLTLTYLHGRQLATYVFIYKTLHWLLAKKISLSIGLAALISGGIGGMLTFRRTTPVDNQIFMYLVARTLIGMLEHTLPASSPANYYSFQAFFTWGLTMYLWEVDPKCLQSTIRACHQYVYEDSKEWKGWLHFLIGREHLF